MFIICPHDINLLKVQKSPRVATNVRDKVNLEIPETDAIIINLMSITPTYCEATLSLMSLGKPTERMHTLYWMHTHMHRMNIVCMSLCIWKGYLGTCGGHLLLYILLFHLSHPYNGRLNLAARWCVLDYYVFLFLLKKCVGDDCSREKMYLLK